MKDTPKIGFHVWIYIKNCGEKFQVTSLCLLLPPFPTHWKNPWILCQVSPWTPPRGSGTKLLSGAQPFRRWQNSSWTQSPHSPGPCGARPWQTSSWKVVSEGEKRSHQNKILATNCGMGQAKSFLLTARLLDPPKLSKIFRCFFWPVPPCNRPDSGA